jgi:hypothetical protein
MALSIDDLNEGVKALTLNHSKERDSLQDIFNKSRFGIFSTVKDLGYWGWTPSGSFKTLADFTTKDVIDQIDVQRDPGELSSINFVNRSLPKPFCKLRPQMYDSKYPYAVTLIAGLHVAVKHRALNIDQDLDFYFGGSVLEMLASQKIQKLQHFLVSLVPQHPRVICVSCFADFKVDLSAPGFQFERLMTGSRYLADSEFQPEHRCHLETLILASLVLDSPSIH